ncbi:MAG: DNA recombination protein RmuC [Zetaproteobacteria bacterium]|nr:MAG: DNA recombination protein RmuC [Zetaproteobacteria bacterium]
MPEALILTLTAIAALAVVAALLWRRRPQPTPGDPERDRMVAALARLEEQNRVQSQEITELRRQEERLRTENRELALRAERLDAELAAERRRAAEAADEQQRREEQLALRFKAIAGEILDHNSRKLVEQHRSSLGGIIDPLREQLEGFRKKVEESYEREARERHSLKNEIDKLIQANARLSEEADNLATALKGSAKTRGNWGEMMLEQILEYSGLIKGVNYETQSATHDDQGRRLLPDVVVHLPEDRHIIIDSKLSLIAYQRYVTAEDEDARAAALRDHVAAMNQHIKALASKEYQRHHRGAQLDFVLMFVPVEPAFMAATIHDPTLFQRAWEERIVIVSPSTLLAMLRTIAAVWRQEEQQRNAERIAQRGAELYRRLANFVADLERVGERLNEAHKAYEQAHKRLATGRGNVIRQAEMLKELGVDPGGRSLPEALVEEAKASEERAEG